jgi:hypothetical protein
MKNFFLIRLSDVEISVFRQSIDFSPNKNDFGECTLLWKSPSADCFFDLNALQSSIFISSQTAIVRFDVADDFSMWRSLLKRFPSNRRDEEMSEVLLKSLQAVEFDENSSQVTQNEQKHESSFPSSPSLSANSHLVASDEDSVNQTENPLMKFSIDDVTFVSNENDVDTMDTVTHYCDSSVESLTNCDMQDSLVYVQVSLHISSSHSAQSFLGWLTFDETMKRFILSPSPVQPAIFRVKFVSFEVELPFSRTIYILLTHKSFVRVKRTQRFSIFKLSNICVHHYRIGRLFCENIHSLGNIIFVTITNLPLLVRHFRSFSFYLPNQGICSAAPNFVTCCNSTTKLLPTSRKKPRFLSRLPIHGVFSLHCVTILALREC